METHDLEEELACLPNMFWENGTLKSGVVERFGDFLGACSARLAITFFVTLKMRLKYPLHRVNRVITHYQWVISKITLEFWRVSKKIVG